MVWLFQWRNVKKRIQMNFPLQILMETLINPQHLRDLILMVIDLVEDLLALVADQVLLRQRLSLKQKIQGMDALRDLDEPQEVRRPK